MRGGGISPEGSRNHRKKKDYRTKYTSWIEIIRSFPSKCLRLEDTSGVSLSYVLFIAMLVVGKRQRETRERREGGS